MAASLYKYQFIYYFLKTDSQIKHRKFSSDEPVVTYLITTNNPSSEQTCRANAI